MGMVAAGDLLRASDPPTYPGCRLRRVANQSIATATLTPISWDQEDQDTDGFIAVTATNVTIPTGLGGLYAITFYAAAGAALAGRCFLRFALTTSLTGLPTVFRSGIAATEVDGQDTIVIPLLAGDSFASQVFHSAGVAVNWTAWLSCYRVAEI